MTYSEEYILYYLYLSDDETIFLSTNLGDKTSFTIDLTGNEPFYVAIRAKNSIGESDLSNSEYIEIDNSDKYLLVAYEALKTGTVEKKLAGAIDKLSGEIVSGDSILSWPSRGYMLFDYDNKFTGNDKFEIVMRISKLQF